MHFLSAKENRPTKCFEIFKHVVELVTVAVADFRILTSILKQAIMIVINTC